MDPRQAWASGWPQSQKVLLAAGGAALSTPYTTPQLTAMTIAAFQSSEPAC
jgi:hypothetical protein